MEFVERATDYGHFRIATLKDPEGNLIQLLQPIAGEPMKIFYGWVIVGVGILVTCVGFGAMLTLSIFLQPMAEAMGWSRTGIAAAALLNFLGMGLGAFLWGALSDRYGTRAVVLCGGALLGLGMVLASQATTLLQFQLLYGAIVGVAAGSFYAPLTSTTTTSGSRATAAWPWRWSRRG